MTEPVVLSVDGSCSGKRAACAAVLSVEGRIVAQRSRSLRGIEGYPLAAEIAAVGLSAQLLESGEAESVVLETDNPDVPRVIREGYRPLQFDRIPQALLLAAVAFDRSAAPVYRVLPRNSTPGLRRADRLAGERLWRKRRKRAR